MFFIESEMLHLAPEYQNSLSAQGNAAEDPRVRLASLVWTSCSVTVKLLHSVI